MTSEPRSEGWVGADLDRKGKGRREGEIAFLAEERLGVKNKNKNKSLNLEGMKHTEGRRGPWVFEN